ncbi:unnamed protein product [Gongylonema pulchrum]|uniref:BTB domain-containing protein n=1 Tax=Gongylonema pulchrum TaxID=637853 RepID=A0A183CWF9_9BILA|nr:unnamed protein product [Gongylonema pulchrum]
MIIDNRRIPGQIIESLPFAIKFQNENIDFVLDPKVDKVRGHHWKRRQLATKSFSDRLQAVRVVDKIMIELGSRLPPLKVTIADEQVKRMKFEMRTINYLYEMIPTFEYGDVVLLFKHGERLPADKSLLAANSLYMASMLHDAAPQAIVDMGSFEYDDFIELLYQIYGSSRPVYVELAKLSRAATAYKADAILARITKFISTLDVI